MILAEFQRTQGLNYGSVQQRKIDLVCGCLGAQSLRDFGGLYLVHGKYLLTPAVSLRAKFASMVDMSPLPEFETTTREAQKLSPGLEVEFVHADFRDPALYGTLRPVDASILFEVLLHQENYPTVIEGVTRRSNRYVCVAQPCIREEEFPLPDSATLLQFWPEDLKDEFRKGSFWPKEPPTKRFASNLWMWGHTASHLVALFGGFGWTPEHGEIVRGPGLGDRLEYVLIRFCRDDA